MQSLIFALNATLPIIVLVMIGYFLKKAGLINQGLAKGMNKLVFRLFLPMMLFVNIYKIEDFSEINFNYIFYTVGLILAIFLVSVPVVLLTVKQKNQRGVILQGIFRSNSALVGVPLAEMLFGTEGVIIASLVSAFVIPTFNILAVISLTVFGGGEKRSFKKVLLNIIKNPLIDAILFALLTVGVRTLFVSGGISFRLSDIGILSKVANYLANVATPLALIVLGAQFELSAIPSLKKQIISVVAMRNVVVPVFAIGTACLLGIFKGAHFAAFMGVFTTPVAVSTVPMAQEMGGDEQLAGQLVVFTTIGSAFTIFLGAFILKQMGIFV